MRLKRTSTATMQALSRTPPSPATKTPEGAKEDRLWGEAMTRFPFTSLFDLPPHPGSGPGLYILDQNNRGLIPRALLQNPEGAVETLEDLFRDTFEEPNAMQVKAEEAFGILIARKVVDNQVKSLLLPPLLHAYRHSPLLAFDLIVTFLVLSPPSTGIGTLG
jgi:hypothetical protein